MCVHANYQTIIHNYNELCDYDAANKKYCPDILTLNIAFGRTLEVLALFDPYTLI